MTSPLPGTDRVCRVAGVTNEVTQADETVSVILYVRAREEEIVRWTTLSIFLPVSRQTKLLKKNLLPLFLSRISRITSTR